MRAMRDRLSWDWHTLTGRVTGSGLAGAALGAAVVGIWQASWTTNLGCPRPSPFRATSGASSSLCLPLNIWLLTVGANCVVIIAGLWIAYTLLRIRPRLATVPGGFIVVVLMVFTAAGETNMLYQQPPPALWVTAPEVGAGLAAFAVIAGGRRIWLAGLLALAVVVTAAVKVPDVVRQDQLANTRLEQFMTLGFPLEAPTVPGYRLTKASAEGGELAEAIDPPTGPQGGPDQITLFIAPVTSSWAVQDRAGCTGSTLNSDESYCSVVRAGVWIFNDPPYRVLAEHAGLMVLAETNSQSAVSATTLITAATSLRPTTVATLDALPA